ncbi:MAG TPA: HAD family hydrolase, partial [Sphingomicrobium sp.]|nr:HAD family hydrolase [Sphingomicrobium sp.]
HGIRHEVICNSGGKGIPARAIIDRHGARRTAFVDDLPVHHASVAKHAPEVHRLHMVAEPRLAPAIPVAEHAHARIDDWPTAAGWILERLNGE